MTANVQMQKHRGVGGAFHRGRKRGKKGGNFVAGDVDMHKCKCHGNTYANYFSHTLPHKNAPQSGRIRIPDTDTGAGTYYVHANGGGFWGGTLADLLVIVCH